MNFSIDTIKLLGTVLGSVSFGTGLAMVFNRKKNRAEIGTINGDTKPNTIQLTAKLLATDVFNTITTP